jgi:hypothetical protein
MKSELDIKPSEELAYWIGVVQTDGCLNVYHDKRRNKTCMRISVDVGKKSLPMLEKFRNISETNLGSKIRIYKCKNEVFKCTLGAKKFTKIFKQLDINLSDPPTPPFWTLNNDEFFGAYLAGIIDGDGSINIIRQNLKGRIRIFSQNKQDQLIKDIRNILNCSVNTRFSNGCYHLEFKISSKNYKFLKSFFLKHLTITHKRIKLENFLNDKFELLPS